MIAEAVYELLQSAVFGDPANTKIYPVLAPQNETRPFVVYTLLSSIPDQRLDGPSGLNSARFQVDCIADTLLKAQEQADAIRLVCDGYQDTIADTVIEDITVENLTELPEPPPEGKEKPLFRVALDLRIDYQQTTGGL